MSTDALEPYQVELIEHAMSVGALKFGSFTLKSGRLSPYFFNAGLLSTGPILSTIASAYAATIVGNLHDAGFPPFDILFGPAYKGISLAACTALVLHTAHKHDVGFAYDRKEAKTHGEGGSLVGSPVAGKRVLILDDVMTAGTAIRIAIAHVEEAGGNVVGVVQCLDREEIGKDGGNTVTEVEQLVGGAGRVKSILQMRDLMKWLEANGRTEELAKMKDYWEAYGIKQ
ncbi:hypothetical protein PLICRDRAFT_105926 [Plicaturopsis crispa FD-325 SS-3]|nr:hypothetical protein PLICRDRAFT_105926 [Plicaturopsis crispa FD-325 SS-3]